MVRVGIVGCGKIAQVRHLPEYEQNPDVRVVALFDLDHERAAQLTEWYGCRACDSVEELLADPDIDAVSVCTANVTHAQIAIDALNAGKHVLCEKPMATTLEDCERMVQAAQASGKRLVIGQNQRLTAAHAHAKELIRAGRIGDPITFRTTFGHGGPETWSVTPGTNSWFFDAKRASMGAMADLGVHKTDLIQFLLDTTVSEVKATVATLDKRDSAGNLVSVDDNAICIYQMENGVVGSMTASWTYYGPEDNSTVVYGTRGIMRIYDDPVHSIVIDLRDGTRELYDVDAIQTNDDGGQTASGVIDAFVACVEGKAEPFATAESVLPAMRAVFAAIESGKTGRAIKTSEL